MNPRISLISIAAMLLFAFASSASASSAGLPPDVMTLAPGIHRLGTAHHTVFGIPVFAATLWVTGPQWSPDKPHALDVEAARAIPPEHIVDKLIDQMRDQGSGTEQERAQWETQLMQFLPELDHGDQLVVFCTAQQPTLMFYNGSKRGQINDPKFCSALFQVWLHPETSNPEVRRNLLQQ